MRTGGAKLTGALVGHSKPDLSVAGTRKTLELFVLDNSLVTDELVSLPYQAALNDTAPQSPGRRCGGTRPRPYRIASYWTLFGCVHSPGMLPAT